MIRIVQFILTIQLTLLSVTAFSPVANRRQIQCHRLRAVDNEDCIDLTEDGGVRKQVIVEGTGEPYESGETVTYSYVGTVATANWNAQEVVNCWLAEQQGLDDVQDKFLELDITEAKLTDLDVFNEEFVQNELGISAKIKCKKLVMAAKRLATTREEYPLGIEFDQNESYDYTMGSGKLIRGMELGLSSMTSGEEAILNIRSDYGYGSEGYRKRNGDVLVPPFATLSFQIKLK